MTAVVPRDPDYGNAGHTLGWARSSPGRINGASTLRVQDGRVRVNRRRTARAAGKRGSVVVVRRHHGGDMRGQLRLAFGALAKHKRRHEREQVVDLPLSSVNEITLRAVMIAVVGCKFPQASDWSHIQ